MPELVGLAIFVISVLSWIISVVNGIKPPPKRPVKAPPAPELRQQIDTFLQELLGQQPGVQPPGARPEKPPGAGQPAPVRAGGEQRAQRDRQRGEQREGNRPKKPKSPTNANTGGAGERNPGSSGDGRRVAERHLQPQVQASAELGQGIAQHVSSHLGVSLASTNAPGRIEKMVQVDLGGGFVAATPAPPRVVKAHPMLALLSGREGVKQAVLLQEVMQPPVSRRQRSTI
jgi:hypothetical protein